MAVIPVIKGLRPFFCFLPSDAKYITPPVTTVNATNNGVFKNDGIINVAGFTYPNLNFNNYGIRVNNNATAVNQVGGVINVAVNHTPNNPVHGVRVEDNGTFTGEAGSEIFIGRTAQYSKNAPTTLIGNTSDQVGILVSTSRHGYRGSVGFKYTWK